jgi:hypothetical protein
MNKSVANPTFQYKLTQRPDRNMGRMNKINLLRPRAFGGDLDGFVLLGRHLCHHLKARIASSAILAA